MQSLRNSIHLTTIQILEGARVIKKNPDLQNYENISLLLYNVEQMEKIILDEAIKSQNVRWPIKNSGLLMADLGKKLRRAKMRFLN